MEKNERGRKEKKNMDTEITSNTKLAVATYSKEIYKGTGISETKYKMRNPKIYY